MRRAGHPVSKRVGNFANIQECQAAFEDAVVQSGDPTLRLNMSCVDCAEASLSFDTNSQPDWNWQQQQAEQAALAAQQAEMARQAESARQARERELAKQREFEQERDRLARELKDSSGMVPKPGSAAALQQLESVAGSSQQAAGSASAGRHDQAQPQADFAVSNSGGIPANSMPVPEPQTSVARLREYVTHEKKVAEDSHAALFKKWQATEKTVKLAAEKKNRKKHQLQEVEEELASLVERKDPPEKIKEQQDSLEAEARALLAEAEALSEEVQGLETQVQAARNAEQEQFQRIMDLNAAAVAVEREPEQAEVLLRKLQEGGP